MKTYPEAYIHGDGVDLFIIVDGVKIAKRGHPGTPQEKTWVSLEPGWTVRDGKKQRGGGGELIVECTAVEAH